MLIRWKLLRCVIVVIASSFLGSTLNGQEGDASKDDVVVLFDGTSLDSWRGYRTEEIGSGWEIVDGVLQLTKGGAGDIVTKEEFSDFELAFEWKVEKGSNSGVMYRVSLGDSAPYLSGPEYQILDDDVHADGKNPLTAAGSLYGLYIADGKELKPVGEWNTAKIVLNGSHVEHWVNGKKVVESDFDSDDWKARLEKSKFKTWPKFAKNNSGHIALQDHGDRVYYRQITVKRLASSEK